MQYRWSIRLTTLPGMKSNLVQYLWTLFSIIFLASTFHVFNTCQELCSGSARDDIYPFCPESTCYRTWSFSSSPYKLLKLATSSDQLLTVPCHSLILHVISKLYLHIFNRTSDFYLLVNFYTIWFPIYHFKISFRMTSRLLWWVANWKHVIFSWSGRKVFKWPKDKIRDSHN